jgi:hypothetical protein
MTEHPEATNMTRVLAIVGSARPDGHTAVLVDAVLARREATRIDLGDLTVGHYEYGRAHDRDDFGGVAAALLAHDAILVATPVYWYAMSGRMKVLFDRLTDLVTMRKDLGRQLRGRALFVAVSGSEPALPDGFSVPFRDTASYFDIHYGGTFYAQSTRDGRFGDDVAHAAESFGTQMFAFARERP